MSISPAATLPNSLLEPGPRDLSAANTLGLAAHAQAYVRLTDAAQMPQLSRLAAASSRLLVLGAGSNVVLPAQVRGLVAGMAIEGWRLVQERPDAWIVEAGAGQNWHDFVAACVEQGWWGLENLALIPGTVGAAPVQNIGAYGVELDQRLLSVSAWDLQAGCMHELAAADCGFAYRDSIFKRAQAGRWVIVSVRFALPRPWRPVLEYPDLQRYPGLAAGAPDARQVFEAVCAIRRAKLPDPAVLGNAGSFFKNPVVSAERYQALRERWPDLVAYAQPGGSYKLAAGWLIDRGGWKGYRAGAVGVHQRQALVLVNHGGARADELLALARAIQDDVRHRFGVELEPEPVVVD